MNTNLLKRVGLLVFFLSISTCIFPQIRRDVNIKDSKLEGVTIQTGDVYYQKDEKTTKSILEILGYVFGLSQIANKKTVEFDDNFATMIRLQHQNLLLLETTNTEKTKEIEYTTDTLKLVVDKLHKTALLLDDVIFQVNKQRRELIANKVPVKSYGISVGYIGFNLSNMFLSPSSVKTKMIPRNGFEENFLDTGNAELTFGYWSGKKAAHVGLLYSLRGCEFEGDFMGYTNGILKLDYLYLSANYQYKFDDNIFTPFLKFRYYIGGATRGKIKEIGGVEEKVKFGKDATLSRFDSGFGLGFGLQFAATQFAIEYNFGFDMSEVETLSTYNHGVAFTYTIFYGW